MKLIDQVAGGIREAAAKSQDVLELIRNHELNGVGSGRCQCRLPLNRPAGGETLFVACVPHRNLRRRLHCVRGRDDAGRPQHFCGRGGRWRSSRTYCPQAQCRNLDKSSSRIQAFCLFHAVFQLSAVRRLFVSIVSVPGNSGRCSHGRRKSDVTFQMVRLAADHLSLPDDNGPGPAKPGFAKLGLAKRAP